ncbi:glycosyltransferase [Pseudomonas nunensis]|uniref:Glycosyltransferase n=1 Tax=Pseudomonas nunensis TaxID=2961896 RepID=A0ABY5EIQ5_9PSED|nr:glycosyltransferase [Pseudomonas nunensis]MCL5230526.1 glycosyltransferase [Pseudomonas nunensis]UTO15544.1 glycosyltransferase [Pseudomonas nunensis]
MTISNTTIRSASEAGRTPRALTTGERSQLVAQVLSACGNGKLLHIGVPDPELLRAFLMVGVQVYNVCPGAATQELNTLLPDRFVEWDGEALPFSDESFSTVLVSNAIDLGLSLEHLALETTRVSERNIFLYLDTSSESSTKEARKAWELIFFNNGARKHPAYYRVNDYQSLEYEQGNIAIPLEKLPREAARLYPLEALKEERDLHMDMTREPGSRSDAHIIRYMLASRYVRNGDRVLDAACGLGYGAYTLFNCSDASSILGVDGSNYAIKYAEASFSAVNSQLTFKEGWLPEALNEIPDNSIDFITSFETLEHVPDPVGLMAEFYRILSPSGRIVLSVPNDWSDETGDDPNPFHFHVYTWDRIVKELEKDFILESAYVQTADQYKPKINNTYEWAVGIREMYEVDTATLQKDDPSCEWCLLVGMKSPVLGSSVPYTETTYDLYPENTEWKATDFTDYENPWLVKGLVTIGHRIENDEKLLDLANQVTRQSSLASPDLGAALCIQAYQLLKHGEFTLEDIEAFSLKIQAYLDEPDQSPQQLRWKVSLAFVMAQLWQATGDTSRAIPLYKTCIAFDCTKFSPTLITKQISAYLNLGLIESGLGNTTQAVEYWREGVISAEKAMGEDWRASIGSLDKPTDFGVSELGAIVELASSCAYSLRYISNEKDRTPQWWHQHLRDRSSQLSTITTIVAETKRLNGVIVQKDIAINELVLEKGKILNEVASATQQLQNQEISLTEILGQKDTVIDRFNSELAQKYSAINELNSELANKESAIDRFNNELSQKYSTINELNSELANKESTIDRFNYELSQKYSTINQLNSELAQKDTAFYQLNSKLNQKDSALEKFNSDLAQKDLAFDQLNSELAQKDSTIEYLNSELAQKDLALDQLNSELAQKDSAIEYLNSEIAQKDSTIDYLNAEHSQKDSAIDKLNTEFAQKDLLINHLNSEHSQKEQKLEHFSRSRLHRLSQAFATQPTDLKKCLRLVYLAGSLITPLPVRRFLAPTVNNLKRIYRGTPVLLEANTDANISADTYIVKQPTSVRNNRPRVLHVIANFMTGGSSRLVVDIYEYLGGRFDQSILTSLSPTPAAYAGITVKEIKLSSDEQPFVQYLESLQPDIIHMHYWGDCDEPWYDQAMLAAQQLNIPVIQNINTPVTPHKSSAIKRYVYVSDYVRNVFGHDTDPNVTVYPGSDFSIFEAKSPNLSDIDTIGMVYRLETDKLNAASIFPFIKAVQKRPQTRVLIVGGGSLMEEFKNAVNTAGVGDNFEFTGYVAYSQLPELYRRMKLFVAPVWKESFGQVSPFAMNMHVPVVGYDIGAIGEIVDDSSLLAPYGDADSLSDIIVNLLENTSRRTLIAQRHRERAQAHFSIKAMIKSYDKIYAATLAEKK